MGLNEELRPLSVQDSENNLGDECQRLVNGKKDKDKGSTHGRKMKSPWGYCHRGTVVSGQGAGG